MLPTSDIIQCTHHVGCVTAYGYCRSLWDGFSSIPSLSESLKMRMHAWIQLLNFSRSVIEDPEMSKPEKLLSWQQACLNPRLSLRRRHWSAPRSLHNSLHHPATGWLASGGKVNRTGCKSSLYYILCRSFIITLLRSLQTLKERRCGFRGLLEAKSTAN